MQPIGRLLVCLLLIVFVGETSGVARAFGAAATVRCCCGAHASARPCPCPDCPVTLRRAAPHDLGSARFAAAAGCAGSAGDDIGLLRVAAVAPRAPFVLGRPAALVMRPVAASSVLRTRAVDVGRPPP